MIESLTQPHETRNKRRWLAHPFRLRVCSSKIKLHSEHSLHFSKFALDILKSVDFMDISIQRRSQGDGIPSTADTETRNSAFACKIPLRKQSESSNREVPSTDPFITGFSFTVYGELCLFCVSCSSCSHSFIHNLYLSV